MPSKRAFEEISNHIEEGIHSGLLKPGHKLSPERELARQFNVSRMSVPKDLRVLEDFGFIYIGTGCNGENYIKNPSSGDIEAKHFRRQRDEGKSSPLRRLHKAVMRHQMMVFEGFKADMVQ